MFINKNSRVRLAYFIDLGYVETFKTNKTWKILGRDKSQTTYKLISITSQKYRFPFSFFFEKYLIRYDNIFV